MAIAAPGLKLTSGRRCLPRRGHSAQGAHRTPGGTEHGCSTQTRKLGAKQLHQAYHHNPLYLEARQVSLWPHMFKEAQFELSPAFRARIASLDDPLRSSRRRFGLELSGRRLQAWRQARVNLAFRHFVGFFQPFCSRPKWPSPWLSPKTPCPRPSWAPIPSCSRSSGPEPPIPRLNRAYDEFSAAYLITLTYGEAFKCSQLSASNFAGRQYLSNVLLLTYKSRDGHQTWTLIDRPG